AHLTPVFRSEADGVGRGGVKSAVARISERGGPPGAGGIAELGFEKHRLVGGVRGEEGGPAERLRDPRVAHAARSVAPAALDGHSPGEQAVARLQAPASETATDRAVFQ